MQQIEFEALLKEIGQKENLPQALELLKASEEEEVALAAESLTCLLYTSDAADDQ